MNKPATHIIHRLNLEIEAPGERQARHLYGQAGAILQQYVLPKLEAILKQYEGAEGHIRLDTLNIDLDITSAASLEEHIKEQLAEAIGKQLKEELQKQEQDNAHQEEHNIKRSTGAQQRIEAFFHFLETGTLPWWVADTQAHSQSQELIEAITQQEEQFITLFLEKVTKQPVLLERLLLQYDAVLLTYLFSLLVPLELLTLALRYEQQVAGASDTVSGTALLRQQYWTLVWHLFPVAVLPETPVETFSKHLEAALNAGERRFTSGLMSGTLLPDAVTKRPGTKEPEGQMPSEPTQEATETSERQTAAGKEEAGQAIEEEITPEQADNAIDENAADTEEEQIHEGLLVTNAGLILLHPFLQYFFLELGLLEGEQFKNKKAKDTAVHLLHYLATGKEQTPDFELVFEKYLCGFQTTQTTYRYTRLSDTMKAEAETLLASVIRHWKALKNTSVSGLQEGFLQRKGKLMVQESNHKLLMERNTLDILLGQIPRNISLIKLPWKKQMLHVEWAS